MPGHFALEFRALENGGEKAVLIEKNILIEGHIGDADGFRTEGGVVAEDGDFVDGIAVTGERRWPSW